MKCTKRLRTRICGAPTKVQRMPGHFRGARAGHFEGWPGTDVICAGFAEWPGDDCARPFRIARRLEVLAEAMERGER